MKSKYYNIKTTVDGIVFASKAEAHRYAELMWLASAGEISSLRCQPAFVLQHGFTHRGKKVLPITYIADFEYWENGNLVVEDVKGIRTAAYLIKKKLLLFTRPGIDFREISIDKRRAMR